MPNISSADIYYSTTNNLGNYVEGTITDVATTTILYGVPKILVTIRHFDGGIATVRFSGEHLMLGLAAGKKASVNYKGNNSVQVKYYDQK